MSGSPRSLRLFSTAALAAVADRRVLEHQHPRPRRRSPRPRRRPSAAPSAPASVAPSEAASPSEAEARPRPAAAEAPAGREMIEMYALDGSYLEHRRSTPTPGTIITLRNLGHPGPRAAPAAPQRRRDRHADVRGPVEGQGRPTCSSSRPSSPCSQADAEHRRRRPDRDRPARRLRRRRLPEDRHDRGPGEPGPGDGAGARHRTTRRACSRRSRRSRPRRKPTASHREPSRSSGRGGSPRFSRLGMRIRTLSTCGLDAGCRSPPSFADEHEPDRLARVVGQRRRADRHVALRLVGAPSRSNTTVRVPSSASTRTRNESAVVEVAPSGRTTYEKVSRPKFAGSAGSADRAAADRGRRRRRRRSSRRSCPPRAPVTRAPRARDRRRPAAWGRASSSPPGW